MAINPLFNAKHYLATNADLIRAGLHTEEQLWDHYVQFGAQESILLGEDKNADRAPNNWFKLDYYLQANPDLIENGITAGTALDHFLNFGIAEGRAFSSSIALSDFDYFEYAEQNADLREAFGIDADFTELTAEQKTDLITHYLSFGYAEDRAGVAPKFEAILAAKNIIVASATVDTVGTIVDDEIRVNVAPTEDVTIDGLGGDDTVVFNVATTVGKDVTLNNIEEVVVNAPATPAVAFTSKQILDQIVVNAATATVTAGFDAKAVAGSSDVLNLELNAAGVNFTTNGIETLNIDLGAKVAVVGNLTADQAKGGTLTVNLTGGDKDGVELGNFNTKASVALTDLVFDATGLAGGFKGVTLTGQALNTPTVTVKGSNAAKNDFTGIKGFAANAHKTNTLRVEAGSKGDDFVATKAIDVFVAGRGVDTFTFATGDSLVRLSSDTKSIVAVDTIEGFAKGDTIKGTGAVAIETSSVVLGDADAFLTYVTTAANDKKVFQYGDDSYVLVTSDVDLAKVELVKIAGVAIDELVVNAANEISLAII